MVTFQKESLALLDATLEKDGMEVAKGIEKIHTGYSSTIMYHDENSLSSVLTIAYLSSMQYYFKPSGNCRPAVVLRICLYSKTGI